jgi:hypothetical protein
MSANDLSDEIRRLADEFKSTYRIAGFSTQRDFVQQYNERCKPIRLLSEPNLSNCLNGKTGASLIPFRDAVEQLRKGFRSINSPAPAQQKSQQTPPPSSSSVKSVNLHRTKSKNH